MLQASSQIQNQNKYTIKFSLFSLLRPNCWETTTEFFGEMCCIVNANVLIWLWLTFRMVARHVVEEGRLLQSSRSYPWKTGFALQSPQTCADVLLVLISRFVCPHNIIIVCCQLPSLLSTLLYTLGPDAG